MATYKHPRPALTVDVVVFGLDSRDDSLDVLLIRRKDKPFAGKLALPGGFVRMKESVEEAAFRELKEETGIVPTHLEQLYTFSEPKRDPRERVVSVAHMALVRSQDHVVTAGSDASEARWYNAYEFANVTLAAEPDSLAFDHAAILQMAISRLQGKIRYAPVGLGLLPETFTLLELRKLYKVILNREPDISNFRRKVAQFDFLVRAGENGKGRPLFRFDAQLYARAVSRGINFEV